MLVCEIILSAFIVGATEVKPGVMKVDLLYQPQSAPSFVETVHVPLDDYLQCWES